MPAPSKQKKSAAIAPTTVQPRTNCAPGALLVSKRLKAPGVEPGAEESQRRSVATKIQERDRPSGNPESQQEDTHNDRNSIHLLQLFSLLQVQQLLHVLVDC